MFGRLFTYVAALPPDKISELSIQDVALCRVWLETSTSLEKASLSPAIVERIQWWLRQPPPSTPPTEGRRQSKLLREVIDTLKYRGMAALQSDEIDLLCATYDLARNANHMPSARLLEILEPHAAELQQRRAQIEPLADMPNLSKRLHILREDDIAGAPERATRVLAGVELPCRGPVLSLTGHVQVLGDIPEGCTLVVSDGSCYVSGYLMGRLAVRQDCEVRGNIAGAAIALTGNIRARTIVNQAYVVAKRGSVCCRAAQGPRLVFAGNQINVSESTMFGRFMSRVFEVADSVRGGEVHIALRGHARYFGHAGSNRLTIVLRKDLQCEDYGEVASDEVNRLLSEASRYRRLAHDYRTMADLNNKEAENMANTALAYLFYGTKQQKQIEDTLAAQRRLSVVRRLMAHLEAVMAKAQDDLARHNVAQTTGAAMLDEEIYADHGADEGMDSDLAEKSAVIHKIRSSISSRTSSRELARMALEEASERYAELAAELCEIEMKLVEWEDSLQSLSSEAPATTASGKPASRVNVLTKLLQTLRDPKTKSPLAARVETPFIDRAMRNISSCLRRAADFSLRAEEHQRDLKNASARLVDKFQMQGIAGLDDEPPAQVTGSFEGNIRIFADPTLVSYPKPPEGAYIVTPDGLTETRTYHRPRDGMFRKPKGPSPDDATPAT